MSELLGRAHFLSALFHRMSVPPVVLDEDTYTAAISKIIERDFFPHLSSIRAKNNYDEAQRSGTLLDLEKAIQEMRQASKPGMSYNKCRSQYKAQLANYCNSEIATARQSCELLQRGCRRTRRSGQSESYVRSIPDSLHKVCISASRCPLTFSMTLTEIYIQRG